MVCVCKIFGQIVNYIFSSIFTMCMVFFFSLGFLSFSFFFSLTFPQVSGLFWLLHIIKICVKVWVQSFITFY